MSKKVVLVTKDERLGGILGKYLSERGIDLTIVNDAKDGIIHASNGHYAAIVDTTSITKQDDEASYVNKIATTYRIQSKKPNFPILGLVSNDPTEFNWTSSSNKNKSTIIKDTQFQERRPIEINQVYTFLNANYKI